MQDKLINSWKKVVIDFCAMWNKSVVNDMKNAKKEKTSK